jgi:hypothetical protein
MSNLISDNKNWSFACNKSSKKHYSKAIMINSATFLNDMKIGYTLNVCCGYDVTGDVCVDKDRRLIEELKVTRLDGKKFIEGDLFKLPFGPLSFDTVICDPPFKFYNRFRWILGLSGLARKRLILSSPLVMFNLKGFNKTLYYINTSTLFIRLWWVFDRDNKI